MEIEKEQEPRFKRENEFVIKQLLRIITVYDDYSDMHGK